MLFRSINVDMVIQNISSDQKTTDVTFTVKRDDVAKTKEILKEKSEIKYKDIIQNDKVAKISIVGAGIYVGLANPAPPPLPLVLP